MIKKTVSYENHDGESVTKDFWFNISKAEFLKKAMTEGGEAYLEQLQALSGMTEEQVANGGGRKVMNIFESLLGDAVGEREGANFVKSDEIRKDFMYSGAYDQLFMDLLMGKDSGAAFMAGLLPKDAKNAMEEELSKRGMTVEGQVEEALTIKPTSETPKLDAAAPQLAEAGKDDEPVWFKEERYPTSKEMMRMDKDQMAFAMRIKQDKYFG